MKYREYAGLNKTMVESNHRATSVCMSDMFDPSKCILMIVFVDDVSCYTLLIFNS